MGIKLLEGAKEVFDNLLKYEEIIIQNITDGMSPLEIFEMKEKLELKLFEYRGIYYFLIADLYDLELVVYKNYLLIIFESIIRIL